MQLIQSASITLEELKKVSDINLWKIANFKSQPDILKGFEELEEMIKLSDFTIVTNSEKFFNQKMINEAFEEHIFPKHSWMII